MRFRPGTTPAGALALVLAAAGCGDGWKGGLPPVAQDPGRVPVFEEPEPAGQRAMGVALELDAPRQVWQGCGVTAHYHTQFSYAVQRGVDGDENPLLDLLFGPEGLSCRLLVLRAVAEDNADPWPPLTFEGGNLAADGTFTLDDPPAVSMVSYLRDRDVEIAMRAERAPEDWVVRGPDTAPDGEPVVRLAPAHYADYAAYLVSYLEALGQAGGRPLWGLIPQNEPDYPAWWAYMLFDPAELASFAADHLAPRLTAASPGAVLVGPDVATSQALPSDGDPRYFTEELNQAFDILDFHLYDLPFADPGDQEALARLARGVALLPADRPVLIEYGNATGRPEDEALGGTPEEMLLAARHLLNMLDQGRASRILWWQGFWDNPASGLIHLDSDNGGWEVYAVPLDYALTPKYFALQHFFRFAPPGARVVMGPPAMAGVRLAAFAGPGPGQLAVVVVHAGDEQIQLTITLRGGPDPAPPATVRHFRTTYAERFEQQPAPEPAGSGVTFSIPPRSLHTLVWELD